MTKELPAEQVTPDADPHQHRTNMEASQEDASMTKLPDLNPGEHYAGLATSIDGKTVHHVILLPGDGALPWKKALKWAKAQGGDLPSRTEALLLFHTLRDQFQREWYWTNQQHADDPACAWIQSFEWGGQGSLHVDDDWRCRAVRRVPIQVQA